MSLPVDSVSLGQSSPQPKAAEVYPASLAQRRLWFLEQLQAETSVYNVDVGLWLYGPLNLAALLSSLQEVVNRQESLRTSFRLQGGEVLQVVAPAHEATIPSVDFSNLPGPLLRAYEFAKREVETPFDLSSGPLFRARIIRVGAEEHIFLCTMHHSITDAWSMQLFVKELGALYEAFSNGKPHDLPDLPIQYGDYSEWQHETFASEIAQQQLDHWKRTLQGAPPVLRLPTDRPRPAEQTFRGATHTSAVPADIVERVKAFAARQQATPFMLFLAAFKVLLFRYTGEADVVVGVPVAGRSRVETEALIGFFVNSLALRSDLNGNPRFIDFLAQVRETTLAAFAHADVPFEQVVEALQPERNLSYNPIFQVMCSSIKSAVGSRDFGNLKVFPYVIDRSTSIFDLNVTLVEWLDGRWWTQIDYNTDLFDGPTIERLQQHFHNLLERIAANPEQRIADLPLLSQSEQRELVVDFNNTSADFQRDRCLHNFFEEQVTRTPDAIAVIAGDERISYGELNQRAYGLASQLLRQGVGPDTAVGICADRCISLLVGILAILKAGGAYVPLDPKYPTERLRLMLEHSGSRLLLAQDKFRNKFTDKGIDFVDLDREWPPADVAQASRKRPAPENLAYILFTSGSTGTPKGVAVEHRNAANFVQWAQTLFTREELAGTLFATSICFDLSIFEMFVPWSMGGTVILAPNALSLPELRAAKKVTLINTVPSIMAELMRSGGVPDSVLTVNLAGEALPTSLVRDLCDRTQVKHVYNLYGPTEATTYATYTRLDRDADVTIGKPIANTQAYILDRNSKLVPRGGRGELYLGGTGLARGYLGQPALTAERFVNNPFSKEPERLYRTGDLCRHRADGSIEYLGRLDHQVKLRGFRIELGEIETTLEKHDTVRQAIVAVRESAGETRLVAYITAKPDRVVQAPELRRHLETTLPSYMIPQAFVLMEEFPRTLNGKVDRRALPAPEAERDSRAVLPRDEVEETLAKIWESVLGVTPVGVTDNFFDLGGHSLMAARLIAQIQDVTGTKIPLSSIFRAPTVEGLARLLADESVAKPDPVLMPLSSGNGGVPFFAIAAPGVDSLGFALLARHLTAHDVYKIQPSGPVIGATPIENDELRTIAREYVAAMHKVQPNGPYCLGGMCAGVHIAQHIIMELEAQGKEVALFAIFDTWVWENSQIRPLWMLEYYRQRLRRLPNLSVRELLKAAGKVLRRSLKRNRSERSEWQKFYWPGREFQAPRFEAPVLLFKRPRQPYFYTGDPQMGWGARSAGGIEICEIDCGHYEILRQPFVQTIAQRLSEKLLDVNARVERSSLRFSLTEQHARRNVDSPLTA
ncbi:MAG: amino acid adenylation domain-containing protein [Candidatus Sulfotelmatobacter sp.]